MTRRHTIYRSWIKPLLDRGGALVMLACGAPLLLAIAFAVRCRLGSPVVFSQWRVGRGGELFRIFKFRTMTDARDRAGALLPDELRLTPFGRWLRATSLDELPELWNVLRGDMSLVGPRPLLPEYLSLYTAEESCRHDVLPGLTGWAQVNGRNGIPWDEKLALDVWYVECGGFAIDVCTLLLTVLRVLRREGVNQPGSATTQSLSEIRRGAIVLGAGGHAAVVISTLQAAGVRVEAVYDDDSTKHGKAVLGVPIRGSIADLDASRRGPAMLALGDSRLRRDLATFYPLDWLTAVHPAATVHASSNVGAGTLVCAGAVVQPHCVIGQHAIINTSATVDHDCKIGNFAHIAPGAVLAGGVIVGEHSLVGVGSCVAPGVAIGKHTIVGAGAVVVGDLPDHVVAIGCPARVVRPNLVADRAA